MFADQRRRSGGKSVYLRIEIVQSSQRSEFLTGYVASTGLNADSTTSCEYENGLARDQCRMRAASANDSELFSKRISDLCDTFKMIFDQFITNLTLQIVLRNHYTARSKYL